MLHGAAEREDLCNEHAREPHSARERFLVLYPEQDRLANAQGCWNWFDIKTGRAWRR